MQFHLVIFIKWTGVYFANGWSAQAPPTLPRSRTYFKCRAMFKLSLRGLSLSRRCQASPGVNHWKAELTGQEAALPIIAPSCPPREYRESKSAHKNEWKVQVPHWELNKDNLLKRNYSWIFLNFIMFCDQNSQIPNFKKCLNYSSLWREAVWA